MPRKYLFTIPIVILIGFIALFTQGLKQDPRLLPSTLIQQQAPTFKLNELETNRVYTEKIFLHHFTLFNVWASWCETCQEEQTSLMQIHKQYPNLQIIGLNEKDDPKKALKWLKDYGNPYRHILKDPDGLTAINYGVYGTPETFLIGSDGIILAKQVGVLDQESFTKVFLPMIQNGAPRSRG